MPGKVTPEKILAILAKALNEDSNPVVLTKDYVNPTAAALLVGSNYEVKKQDGTPYHLTPIQKMDIMQEFNRNDQFTGQTAKERLALVFDNNAFMSRYHICYGDQLTIPIDMRASLPEQLISTIRAGTQVGINRRELGAVFGMELYLLHVELQKDIPIQLIRNNLYNPNFEAEIDAMLNTELSNDFLRLATNGYADSYSSIGGDFYALAIGHEKILQSANGSWTNSNGSTLVLGRWGNRVTPNKVNIGSVTGISSLTEIPTGDEILAIFDGLIDNHPHDYKSRNNVLIVSPEDFDIYVKSRANPVLVKDAGAGNATSDVGVNNTYREQIRNSWVAPPYRGKTIIQNPYKRYIGQVVTGTNAKPNIIFAPLEEFYVGAQNRIDQDRRYEPRSADGGPAIEITKHFWIDFQIRNREACSIAFYGATCETMILSDSDDIKAGAVISGDLVAADIVYPYCDTKGVRQFVAVSTTKDTATALLDDIATCVAVLGTGEASTAELEQGEAYTLAEIDGAKTYFEFAAFKDGILLVSTIVSLSLDIT